MNELIAPDLLRRAAEALADPHASFGVLADLQDEVNAARESMTAESEAARERAILDPALTVAAMEEEQRAAQSLIWQAERLERLAERLSARVTIADNEAHEQQKLARYDAAKAKRDAVAERVRQEYPALARRLADLAAEIVAADLQIEGVSHDHTRPAEMPPLSRTEGYARGFPDPFQAGNPPVEDRTLRIACMIVPDFDGARDAHPIWPPAWGIGNQEIERPRYAKILSAFRQSRRA